MNKSWIERLRKLEGRLGKGRVPRGMGEVTERWVKLGLGEVEPSEQVFEPGIAWMYRGWMDDLHVGKRAPESDFERDMLVRYRDRLVAGLVQPFTFEDKLDVLEQQ
jgi:hypothetical protein